MKMHKKLAATLLVAVLSIDATSMTSAAHGKWVADSKGWWYQNPDDTYPAATWMQDSDELWYRFNSSGYMQTGWLQDGKTWYYLNPKTDGTQGSMKTGWIQDGTNWYYLDPTKGTNEGSMKTGWIPDGTKWYFTDSSGAMQTGLVQVDGKIYYLNPVSDGTQGAVQTGSVVIDGKVYTFDADGAAYGNIPNASKSYMANGSSVVTVNSNPSENSVSYSNPPSSSSSNTYTITEEGNYTSIDGKANLLIAASVGNGDVTLNGVNITGTVTVQGGGKSTVTFKDCVLGKVKADKDSSSTNSEQLHIAFTGGTSVNEVSMDKAAHIEINSSGNVQKVAVNAGGSEAKISGTATLPKVEVHTQNPIEIAAPTTDLFLKTVDAEVTINANVTALVVEKTAAVTIADGKTVMTLGADAAVTVTGNGTVSSVVESEGITINKTGPLASATSYSSILEITAAGTYDYSDIAPGVIKGLIITEAVENGTVTVKNLLFNQGVTQVKGGGTVTFDQCSLGQRLVADKASGEVLNITFSGMTDMGYTPEIVIEKPANIKMENRLYTRKMVVNADAIISDGVINGNTGELEAGRILTEVVLNGEGVQAKIKANVSSLVVNKSAEVTVDQLAKVLVLRANADVTLDGKGIIQSVVAKKGVNVSFGEDIWVGTVTDESNKNILEITGITVSPSTTTVSVGATQFSATVLGTGNPPQSVNWMLNKGSSGGLHDETTLDQNGLLTVHQADAGKSIIMSVASTADASKWCQITVTVEEAE